MTEQPAAPKAKRTRKAKNPTAPTEYVVLEQVEVAFTEGDKAEIPTWIEADRVTAHGQEKTIIEKWATAKGKGGTFKLVPARSWKGGVRIFEQTRMASEPLS